MKRLTKVIIIAAYLTACNSNADTTAAKKDSIDSVTVEEIDKIDSTAQAQIKKVDSLAEVKKRELDKERQERNKIKDTSSNK